MLIAKQSYLLVLLLFSYIHVFGYMCYIVLMQGWKEVANKCAYHVVKNAFYLYFLASVVRANVIQVVRTRHYCQPKLTLKIPLGHSYTSLPSPLPLLSLSHPSPPFPLSSPCHPFSSLRGQYDVQHLSETRQLTLELNQNA